MPSPVLPRRVIEHLYHHRDRGRYTLNALSLSLYPKLCHLSPTIALTFAVASANAFLFSVGFNPPASNQLSARLCSITGCVLISLLRQLVQKAKQPIGRMRILVETDLGVEGQEGWHSQIMWLVYAFLEEGWALHVTITMDHFKGRFAVQLAYQVGE